MLVLPITFLFRGGISLRGIGGVTDSGGCIDCSGDRMPGNMCGRHGLPCGTGSRMSWGILFDLTRGCMSI